MTTLGSVAKERTELLNNHPVITKNYTIITPVITMVYGLIRDRVWMRSTGTVLYGNPRMGKSTCADIIQLLLEAEFENILIIKFTAEYNRKKDSGLFIDILQSEKIHFPKSARFKDLQTQLITLIQAKLSEKKGQQFILMIDEMHKLSTNELDMLSTIHNRLQSFKIWMTTLGFAQPEIMNLRAGLQTTGYQYLIARFLSEPIPFDGCLSKSDLEKILNAYDEKLFFPEDSECSFTNFFLPMAFEKGLRLESFSKEIWTALQAASSNSMSPSIPMLYLSKTVETLLVIGSRKDGPKFKFDKLSIAEAVDISGLQLLYQ